MKTRHVMWLGAAAAIAVAGAVVVGLSGGSDTGSDVSSAKPLFPGLAARVNEVGRIIVARKAETVTIAKQGDGWTVAEKHGYPAAFAKVRKLLVDLAELRPLEQKTSTPDLFPELELEDLSKDGAKSVLVTLKSAAEQDLLSLYVGKQRFGRGGNAGDGTYVRKAGENQTWLAKGRLSLEQGSVNWLDRALIDVTHERVAMATVVQPDGAKLVVTRSTPAEKNFSLVDLPKGRKAKSEWDVDQVASALEHLELDDVRPAAEVTVPDKPAYAVYATFDGLDVRVNLVPKDGQVWLRFSAKYAAPSNAPTEQDVKDGKLKSTDEVKKDVDAFNAKTTAWAYRIPDWKLDNLRKKTADLLVDEKDEKKKDQKKGS